jgi:hypothetical protein
VLGVDAEVQNGHGVVRAILDERRVRGDIDACLQLEVAMRAMRDQRGMSGRIADLQSRSVRSMPEQQRLSCLLAQL